MTPLVRCVKLVDVYRAHRDEVHSDEQTCWLVPFLSAAPSAQSEEPSGDAASGQRAFMGANGGAYCGLCHGFGGRGGFGPDLAGGRGLTFAQFTRAVRQPWGVMPRFPRVADKTLADIYAYLLTTDPVDEPGAWRVGVPPAGAPRGQLAATSYGCTQCHSGEMLHPLDGTLDGWPRMWISSISKASSISMHPP